MAVHRGIDEALNQLMAGFPAVPPDTLVPDAVYAAKFNALPPPQPSGAAPRCRTRGRSQRKSRIRTRAAKDINLIPIDAAFS